METENMLIPVGKLLPDVIFKKGGSTPILEAITAEVEKFVPETSTAKGRSEIASMAHKVSRSKTFLDNMGKETKAKYKKIIDPIDGERKAIRDHLDALRDKVRKPLTEWEAEQARIKAEAEARKQYEADWDRAIIDNDLFNRERELARKEAELKAQEEERRAKEEADRKERERIENEERLKKEAAEKAKREAEEKAEQEKQEALRKQIEAEQAAKKAEEDKKAAELRAKLEAEEAERKRLADLKAAEEKAEREKKEALEKQRRDQEEKERLKRERLEKIRQEEEARKADIEHRTKINWEILSAFMAHGLNEDTAKALIISIAKGEIEHVSINY